MIMYRADDGSVAWDVQRGYSNPPILHGNRIITHGKMYDLLTGEPTMRTNPLTGASVPWAYQRTKGCNYHIASEHLLTFRSSAAAYFDLDSDGGTGHFGGFKSGCSNNLIVADGLLNAPDYTRTCSCAYQNQTSLAMIHMPEVEVWTTCPALEVAAPVQRVGFNLGASGDRKAEDGTLWLEYPIVGGASPEIEVRAGNSGRSLVARGAEWKYLDNGSDQGNSWRAPVFDDAAWKSGPAELGYGDKDEATVVSFGEDKAKKHITTYFRRAFDVPADLAATTLDMKVKLDDGAVVYL
ncbi:MAG: hypothetical protein GY851_13290, partial [bacterium]|nr:hypothetical protein [bacterium]